MKCPNCDKELSENKLYCEYCGYEIQMVPDFEPEIENSLTETLSGVAELIDDRETDVEFEESMERPDLWRQVQAGIEKWISKGTGASRKARIPKMITFFLLLVFVAASLFAGIYTYQYNSYNYQMEKALNFGNKEAYVEAAAFLERALEIDGKDPDATLLLAEYYSKQGKDEDAVIVLEGAIKSGKETEEIYRKLIDLFESKKQYQKISEVLSECKQKDILTVFQKYAALPPEFSVPEGIYQEIVPLKLMGNTSGKIYYTLDGSAPKEGGVEYTSPIFLESGKYVVTAFYINQFGVRSGTVQKIYEIEVEMPDPPVIPLYSGVYQLPEMIVVEKQADCRVYYTTDGNEPSKDSTPYESPIPMPFGATDFKFIAFNEEGVASDSVERVYQLEMPSNMTSIEAVQNTVVALMEQGKLLDPMGHVPDLAGRNIYVCTSGITVEGQPYYLVQEQYEDAKGTVFATGNQYAVNSMTGEIGSVVVDDTKHFQVNPFEVAEQDLS